MQCNFLDTHPELKKYTIYIDPAIDVANWLQQLTENKSLVKWLVKVLQTLYEERNKLHEN